MAVLAACGSSGDESSKSSVTIGSGNFPESVLLAHIYAGALEAEGIEVDTQLNIGSREIYFGALEDGEIDLVPEYIGALHTYVTGGDAAITTTEQLFDDLGNELSSEVTVLQPAEAQNQNAHLVTQETAEKYGLQTLSDLAEVSGELIAGGAPEAAERPNGLPGLKKVYGIEFAEYKALDNGGPLTIAALDGDDIDVARAYSTMGVINDRGWVILEDDQHMIPAENVIPAIREDAATTEVQSVLDRVSAALTTNDLIEMNKRVQVDKDDPELVAKDWLEQQGI